MLTLTDDVCEKSIAQETLFKNILFYVFNFERRKTLTSLTALNFCCIPLKNYAEQVQDEHNIPSRVYLLVIMIRCILMMPINFIFRIVIRYFSV